MDIAEVEALTAASISCALATITVVCYRTCHSILRRRALETVMSTLAVGLWGVGLFKIMDPRRAIPDSSWGYFGLNAFLASWVCFALVVLLIFSLGQEVAGVNNVNSPAQKKTLIWYLLAASSLVVMGSGIVMFKSSCHEYYFSHHSISICMRSKFAIFAGIIGLLLSGTMTVLLQTGVLTAWIEMCPTVVLLVIWCVGVRFIVSDDHNSPGHWCGTLYLSFWISFVLIVVLFGIVFQEVMRGGSAQHEQMPSTVPLQDGNNGLGHATEQPQAHIESSGNEKLRMVKSESDVEANAKTRDRAQESKGIVSAPTSDYSNNNPIHSPEWQPQGRQEHAFPMGYTGLMPIAPPLPTASDTSDVEKGLLEQEKGQHIFPVRKNPQGRKKQNSEKLEGQEATEVAQLTVREIPNEAPPFVPTARAESAEIQNGERQEQDLPIAIAEPAVPVIPEPVPSTRTENIRLSNSQGWAEDVSVTVSERIETQPNGLLVKVVTEETLNPDGSKTVKIRRYLRQA